MLPIRNLATFLCLSIVILLIGCSNSGDIPSDQSSPLTPPISSAQDNAAALAADNVYSWGLYDITIDPETWEIDVVPMRTADLTVNPMQWMQPPNASSNKLTISNLDVSQWASGILGVDVQIAHPFPGFTQFTGFDMMVLFISDGSISGLYDTSVNIPAQPTDAVLLNPDGYTRWMNRQEFTNPGITGYKEGWLGTKGQNWTSTVNPFKYYATNLGDSTAIETFYANSTNVSNRGLFAAGGTAKRRMQIQFPTPGGSVQLRFQYEIIARWMTPSPKPPVNVPGDFPANANAEEAFYVKVTNNSSTLNWHISTGGTGTLNLDIEVFDWQGASNPSGFDAEIAAIIVENYNCTFIPANFVDVFPTAVSTAGSCANSRNYSITIPGCTPTAPGTVNVLVTVESANPTIYGSGSGFPTATLAAYAIASVPVTNNVITNNPPVAPTPTGQSPVCAGEIWPYTCASSDPDSGDILTHTWSVVANGAPPNYNIPTGTSNQLSQDWTGYTAGLYDISCRVQDDSGQPNDTTDSPVLTVTVNVNNPPLAPAPTGTTPVWAGSTWPYTCASSDPDVGDILTHTWSVVPSGSPPSYTVSTGILNQLSQNWTGYTAGLYDIRCRVSDSSGCISGFTDSPALVVTVNFNNPPIAPLPTGNAWTWLGNTAIYTCAASDPDFNSLTYIWSIVASGSPANYNLPGDLPPGTNTLTRAMTTANGYAAGLWDISCQVTDNSGAPNNTTNSPTFTIVIYARPYVTGPLPGQIDMVLHNGPPFRWPSTQGWLGGCFLWWDGFYNNMPILGPPAAFQHSDISIISGSSLGTGGVMVVADEQNVWGPALPAGQMRFAHFLCPFTPLAAPSWTWWNIGRFPGGPDIIPSVVHFDSNINTEFFVSTSFQSGKLGLTPDPAAWENVRPWPLPVAWRNDLYTSHGGWGSHNYDVAADTSNGFDMGSPSSPANPPMYAFYTQEMSNILGNCFGGFPVGPPHANPVNFLRFPSGGVQPVGVPIDFFGGPGVWAPLPGVVTSPAPIGPGVFCYGPGGPSPGGPMTYPEPYYALGVDDDMSDDPWPSGLPAPLIRVFLATIDGDRDVEVYEADFGVFAPGPAPIIPWTAKARGTFGMGTFPNAYPVDLEYVSNFNAPFPSGKPAWSTDLLAVLCTDPIAGVYFVEILENTPGALTTIGITPPFPLPPMNFLKPAAVFRMDVDELTGDIYVIHESAVSPGGLGITIFRY